MALYAMVSAGGSPGVTTAALALALTWPAQVIVAECDPSGGDVLAGLFAGHLPATSGLLPLAMEAGGSPESMAAAIWQQVVDLDGEHSRVLLPGITDPRQAAGLAPSWPALAGAMSALPTDVIADCGRLDPYPASAPVLGLAQVAILVLRPTLRQVSKARQRIEMLAEIRGGTHQLVLLLIGDGTYSGRDVSDALGVPVAGSLTDDHKTASVLSDGTGSRRGIAARPLLRSARPVGRVLRETLPGALEISAGVVQGRPA
ncbi:MAG TPA: hypothetical protein VN840_20655 [Streptosporangiaceae bacterium]|nr:hypothetical protein [Streptosporangiaceae bacterium]